jgi:uncharacterized membrane protein
VFWILNVLLGAAFVAELFAPKASVALDQVTIVLAAVAAVAALKRQLPLQNVLPAALVAACIGGVAHAVSSRPNFSLPFGPVVFGDAAGERIFNVLPWTVPFLWVAAIFNARGTARLMLRPWRKVKAYGFWLIGFTALLAVAFDVALEPFAWHVKHFWLWQPTRLAVTWEGATLLNFVGWACVALLIMMVITPSLIRKQPGNAAAPDLHPLILWLGALLLFAVGCAGARLWWPVAVDAALAAVTAFFAVRGARW